MWYALRIGFSYEEALDQPVSRILTLMAIEQIKHEGAELFEKTIDVFDNETMDEHDLALIFPDWK